MEPLQTPSPKLRPLHAKEEEQAIGMLRRDCTPKRIARILGRDEEVVMAFLVSDERALEIAREQERRRERRERHETMLKLRGRLTKSAGSRGRHHRGKQTAPTAKSEPCATLPGERIKDE